MFEVKFAVRWKNKGVLFQTSVQSAPNGFLEICFMIKFLTFFMPQKTLSVAEG